MDMKDRRTNHFRAEVVKQTRRKEAHRFIKTSEFDLEGVGGVT